MTTEDLKSMTVEEMFNWAGGFNYDLGLDVNGHTAVARELASRLEEAQQKIVAQEAKDNYVGRWLSAALDDPSVCEEMKADIGLWMASDYAALTTHDAELTAKAKAEALEELSEALMPKNPEHDWTEYASIKASCATLAKEKAAEYRAKAKGEKP